MRKQVPQTRPTAARHGVARVISKLGLGSRTQATVWVSEGRVRVNGTLVRNPDFPVRQGLDRIDIEGQRQEAAERIVVMLNKPRGLVTTTRDEQGRDTVYRCLEGAALPWLAPVGRLDKASEGLLLFTNDPQWAARLTDPVEAVAKTYHVQIDRIPDDALLQSLQRGVQAEEAWLAAKSVRCLRQGGRNAWLEVVLEEGRNRQIRRLLASLDVSVLRLVRVGLGGLSLGPLAKGQWRRLTSEEITALSQPARAIPEALPGR